MKQFKKLILLGIVTLLLFLNACRKPTCSLEQGPFTLWTRTYGGNDDDGGNSVQETSDGGYIIAGSTRSFGSGGSDVYLIKTDANGELIWTKTFGGEDSENGLSVQQTSDNGYIIAGYTCPFGSGDSEIYLIKTDAQGDALWARTYGGGGGEWAQSVSQTFEGGYIVTGVKGENLYLMKTDENGDTLWTKTYKGWGNSVQQTSDGGYIVTGWTSSFGAGGMDVYLVKTDTDGNTTWTKTFGGKYNDSGLSVQQTSDGGYIITGWTASPDTIHYYYQDVYLIKTNENGDTLWTKIYGGPDHDNGHSVVQTSDGGYIIAGETLSYGSGDDDVYLIRTDSNGDTIWTKTYGGQAGDFATSVQETYDGGYIIVGERYYISSETSDVYLLKIK